MKKFKKLVVLDETKMTAEALRKLHSYAEEVKEYKEVPKTESEVINRIGDADAVLVSWRTEISAKAIEKASNLRYIGMACSLLDAEAANVDIKAAEKKNIKVSGIFDYGDPGVVEFVLSKSIDLLHGFGKEQLEEMPRELSGCKVGIIGLGTTGQLLAKALLALNADVYYYSRTRKQNWEEKGVDYLSLNKLLTTCTIISLHLPKNTCLLDEGVFKNLGDNKILINTSLGLPYRQEALKNWLENTSSYAIADGDAASAFTEEIKLKNLLISKKSAGWSKETQNRLSDKVVKNIAVFLNK